jgi:hypothetical protein
MPGTGTLSKSVAVQNEDSELWIGREILDPDTQPGGELVDRKSSDSSFG